LRVSPDMIESAIPPLDRPRAVEIVLSRRVKIKRVTHTHYFGMGGIIARIGC